MKVNLYAGDVSDGAAVADALSNATKASGTPAVAIAAAGYADPKYFEDLNSGDFLKSMQVNYLGVVHLAQAYLTGPPE